MQKPADLLERLVDFDHCGNTATERFTLRMEAWEEIKRLRADLTRVVGDYGSYVARTDEELDAARKERDAARRALERVRTADNMSCVWHIVEAALLSWRGK